MQKWADNTKAVQDESIKLAIITANNHYSGFGPAGVEILLPANTHRYQAFHTMVAMLII
jgi:hypothetical protein